MCFILHIRKQTSIVGPSICHTVLRNSEWRYTSQNPKRFPRIQNWSQNLDSGTCFWILGRVLDSGKCFGFWEVFWVLGSVFGFWDVFGFWEEFLDSGTCFGFWEVFLDAGECFGFWEMFLNSGKCCGIWKVFCPHEPPYLTTLITQASTKFPHCKVIYSTLLPCTDIPVYQLHKSTTDCFMFQAT